ncbi:glycosyltransferase [Arthrobacter sp. SX1312]|uniref:glycosyltransferase n=1 Tax=Arthrobacter sp. SX1312 TaxID=2058896 RepID=UPI000CE52EF2|nr:glycosyltransferase [Arthrobacter sp. SX1312]
MKYEDERTSVSPVEAARRAEYLADLDGFISAYHALTKKELATRTRAEKLSKDLETTRTRAVRFRRQVEVLRREKETLQKEKESLRKERESLRRTLESLRGSWRYRIGTAATAPARSATKARDAVAGYARSLVPAAGPAALSQGSPAPDVTKTPAVLPPQSPAPRVGGAPPSAPKQSTSQAAAAKAVPKVAKLSADGPIARKAELQALVESDPSKHNVYRLVSHCYFVLGEILFPAALIASHPGVLVDLAPKENQLIDAVMGQAALLGRSVSLPPRQPNAGYDAERGRIMYCAHSVSPYNSNGYSTRTSGLIRGLRNAGGKILVAARPGYPWDVKTDRPPSSPESYEETLDGVVHHFSNGPSWTQGRLDHYIQEAADHYVQLAIRNRVERIHAASNYVTALPALIAARRLGLQFTYEVRGLWEITEASTKPAWDTSDRFRLARTLETVVAADADAILAITPQVRDELIRRGADARKISILPNAVDTDEFTDMPPHKGTLASLKLEPGRPVIGYAGSLVEYEGLQTLLSAVRLLLDRGVRTTTVIVGDGPALAALKSTVEEGGLSDSVIFTGRVPAVEVARFVSVFDIMPCPRLSLPVTEMVPPLKPLEAMAAGKAVVLSDLAPLRDLAGSDGERARLFQAGNAEHLAAVLEDLASNPEQGQVMGRRARLWTVGERTWDQVGATALRFIADALPPSTAKGADLGGLTLGIIADEFTRAGLGPDIGLLVLDPDKWERQLTSTPIDALFVESAWEGNDGLWRGKVGYYDDDSFADLAALVAHCREHAIPTIFWNKEDPVHINRFKRTAQEFEYVFTSDDGSIPTYLKAAGPHLKSVASLPFYAQPALHNPMMGARPYSHTVCYAGSYYGDRYKERSGQLHRLLDASVPSGLTIYDRQFENPDSPYRFPAGLVPYVRGGLSYTEMVEAYKTHPVHLNVNSVRASGTMFSRRVFEIAASGNCVISGPGRGVERLFDGAIPVVEEKSAARALVSYWMTNEGARNADAWRAMRTVFRSHTAAHRLAYVLRTAGLEVQMPALEKYALVVPVLTPALLEQLVNQSVRPSVLLVEDAASLTASVSVEGVTVQTHSPDAVAGLVNSGVSLLGHLRPTRIDRTFYEDLLHSRKFYRWSSARFAEDTISVPGRGLSHLDDDGDAKPPAADLLALNADASAQPLVLRRRVSMQDDRPEGSLTAARERPLCILVAGHDLKFARGIIAALESEGHRVLIDHWQGHSQHDEEGSRTKLAEADVIFCEWTLGNAVWFSRNKRPDQQLICRVHLQEIHTPYLKQVDVRAVDQFIFVGQHIASIAERDFGVPRDKIRVIPNVVDVLGLKQHKSADARWNLGFVGMVPQRKRLDLALDVLRDLRSTDERYSLFVKGKRPEDFPWMATRQDELAYYVQQYRRIEEDPLLQGAVTFDPQGDDMASWYRKIGTVISVSDFESFHLTLADGAASGALPVSLAWAGADQIYPVSWMGAQPKDLVKRILDKTASHEAWSLAACEAQAYAAQNFSSSLVLDQLKSSIVGR